MKLYKPEDLISFDGSMMLFYGESGVGKSVTAIQTAQEPILYIMAEGRDVTKMLDAAERPGLDITFGFYTTWDDMMETVCNVEELARFKTIVIDSLSHLVSICLPGEILDENFEALDKKKGIDKPLTMQVKMSQEGYGTLGGQMLRFTNAATRLTHIGHVVVCIARLEQNPKFNRSLSASPALKGQEYAKHMQGFFDFVGLVERRVEDGVVVYPPYVSFESDGSFMAKWSGIAPKGGVYKKMFHIEKILQTSKGGAKKDKKNAGKKIENAGQEDSGNAGIAEGAGGPSTDMSDNATASE